MALELSQETLRRIDEEILPSYPVKISAILPVLWAIQEEHGYISRDAMLFTAEVIGESPAHVFSCVTFYTMFHLEPVGKIELKVCKTIACEIMGCKNLSNRIREKLGIESNQSTDDGMFHLEEVECLAACELAPVVQVNEDLYGPLTDQQIDVLIDELKTGLEPSVKPCL